MIFYYFLRPLDTLFFRDGRPFGEAFRGNSTLPLPQTLHGAVLSSLLNHFKADFNEMAKFPSSEIALKSIIPSAPWLADLEIQGPWLAKREAEVEIYYPAPSILMKNKKVQEEKTEKVAVTLLPRNPSDIPGWKSEYGLHPLWTKQTSSTPAVGYLRKSAMEKVLGGLSIPQSEIIEEEKLFGFQNRTGIGISPDTNTIEESIIYCARHLCLKKDFGFAFSLTIPDQTKNFPAEAMKVISWGGEGRRVALEPLARLEHPEIKLTKGQKPYLVLTTPGIFHHQTPWKPDYFKTSLLAASVPSSIAVSGWDLRQGGPKPTRFGVAAGSTYFLQDESEIPPSRSLCDPTNARLGWGCFLKGAWNDER